MDETTICFLIFLISVFIANEIVLWKKRQARKIEHRVFNVSFIGKNDELRTGKDQIWLREGKVIKVITHDGLVWTECYPGLVRALDGGGAVNE